MFTEYKMINKAAKIPTLIVLIIVIICNPRKINGIRIIIAFPAIYK